MINAQINQPAMNKQAMPNQTMVNLAQPNQMMNQSAKMPQINQVGSQFCSPDNMQYLLCITLLYPS